MAAALKPATTPSGNLPELAQALHVLANETRLRLLDRLAQPAYVRELAVEFHLTRQALARHLDDLAAAGLIEIFRGMRRGLFPATQYRASPTGLFAFKEHIRNLALPIIDDPPQGAPTRLARHASARPSVLGPGLLLAYGDLPGRWFSLRTGSSWIIGRDPKADVSLAYDPFVSGRHAHLQREGQRWTVTDLHSTNRTLLNFDPVPQGEAKQLQPGDLLTIGRSGLILRGA